MIKDLKEYRRIYAKCYQAGKRAKVHSPTTSIIQKFIRSILSK